ncbi:ATP-binding protein [Aquabacterium sp. A08]|uniref:two-component system sensor histidine kinase NtrB n=1 Tax=Aquabacterium sp. A08 TaxID=2718532 RepID=UPI00141FDE2B|nr:PAS domain S-box protein [Aquabacterium sp. A08]
MAPTRWAERWAALLGWRWALWGALCLLVGLLLAALVFLAREYEDGLALSRQERSAADIAADVRSGLVRNLQDLIALHSTVPAVDDWPAPAARLLASHREIAHLEWRDNRLAVRAERTSPYRPDLFVYRGRHEALPDVTQACALALRTNAAAYAPSYFWPLAQGAGVELMEMCLPVTRDGQADGYLVATYALASLLTELVPAELQRGQRMAWTEADGTRLSIVGNLPASTEVQPVQQVFDLPGATYMLRLERPREGRAWFPHVLTVAVGALALALLGVLALFARDLRRRQRAERGLADALAFRKAMEDSLVTGLRARDMDGRITYVNPAFCQMLGLPPERLLGSGVPAPYWPPEQVDEYRQRLAVRLAGQLLPREGFESEFVRADGSRFPVLIIEAPLIDARGVQTGWMSAILDLSEQRRSEESLRASQERLQATARLAMAGEMASLISHELNQPLAAIASYASGSLNLLGADDPGAATGPAAAPGWRADVALALRRIAEQAERAGKVIKSVGDLVRRRERAREAVPLAALFDGIVPLVQLQGRKLGIAVEVAVAPDCPPAWCDRTMVEQVLLNLARNGMQAMPPGDPPTASGLRRLRLSATPRPAAPGAGAARWIECRVSDHGHGLTPEQAERLFTPFYTTKPEGMGLGLNLCRTVVEQHGGALYFEPNTPRGTVFGFTLPAAALS